MPPAPSQPSTGPPDGDKVGFSELNIDSISYAFKYPHGGAKEKKGRKTRNPPFASGVCKSRRPGLCAGACRRGPWGASC